MEKKIRAQPLGTKKNSCTAQRRKKKFLPSKNCPTPPSKIKWSIPNKQIYHAMKKISVCHQLGSYELNKILLSCFEDERYILADGKTSNAYRHCKTDSHIS